MGDTWIVDITHYEGLPPHLLEGPAGRMALFFGSIVSAASVSPLGVWVESALWCRRRPRRRKCPGHIQLYRAGASSSIEWHCSCCDDQGVISNWKGTTWDLSRWARYHSAGTKLYDLVLTQEELHELRNNLTFDPESDCLVYGAIITQHGIVMRATAEELDNLQGYIAAEANHEEKKRRRNILDRIYEKVDALLEEHLTENAGLTEVEHRELSQLSSEVQRFLSEIQRRFIQD